MNQIWKEIGLSLILGLVVPGLLLHLAVAFGNREEQKTENVSLDAAEDDGQPDIEVRVLSEDGTVSVMELETYITGVVLAEQQRQYDSSR